MMKRLRLKPIAITLLALVLLGIGAAALFAARPAPAGKTAATVTAPKPALTVTIALPQTSSLPITLAANGDISAWQEASIGSEASGLRLAEVRANVGDTVRAGQVLAVFAADTVQADVAQARASVLEAEANAMDASGNAARARTLQSSGAMSAQQINQYITGEQTAKARLEAAKAMLQAQQLRLKQTRLLAPDDGVISARTATVGAVTGAGTELFRMIRQGRLEWRAEVTATELGRVRPGTTATIKAANGAELTGKVRMIAPTVDLQKRSALVYVDLPVMAGKDAPARAGMFARGEFDLGKSDALTVPQQAVVVRDGFSYVFRMNADNRVSQVKVETGRRVGDRVEVRDGVGHDTVLVASGAGFLNDGDLVKSVQAGSAPQGEGASQASAAPVAVVK
ncbi:MAG: transporter [Herminiimonas sp.]|nr:transporter [Herminiimonas sp.]